MTTLETTTTGLTPARGAAAAGSVVAALAHYAVVPGILGQGWTTAALFSAAGLVQLIWAALILTGGERPVLFSGLVINLGIVSLWAVTRTIGLPFGPGSGAPIAVGLLDGICAAAEAGAVIASVIALRPAGRRSSDGR